MKNAILILIMLISTPLFAESLDREMRIFVSDLRKYMQRHIPEGKNKGLQSRRYCHILLRYLPSDHRWQWWFFFLAES